MNFDPVMAESAQSGVTINYKGQPKLAVKPARARKDVLMMLPTAAMDASFRQEPDYYVGAGGSGAVIGKRYAGFAKWIEEHDQYEVPEVYVHTDGKLSFTNGRHRYAVLRDAGVAEMPVAMSRSGVENAKRLMRGVIREADDNADRLARARAMGFDTDTVWYHGTNADIHSFKGDLGVAAHLTRGADVASEWASISSARSHNDNPTSIYPVFIRVKNVFDLRRHDHQNMIDFLEDDEDYNYHALERYIPEIIAAGFDAYWDFEDANNLDNEDNIAVIDPKNIRSVHAQFRDANSDQLMASVGITEMADPKMIRDAVPRALASLKLEIANANVDGANENFMHETGIEDDDPKWDEKFAIWKEGYAQRRIGMAIGVITKGAEYRGGKMMVYRMVEVDAEEFLNGINAGTTTRGLGEYWTWSRNDAQSYAGYGGDEVLLTGLVDPIAINWAQTILMNAHPSTDDEKEITIPEGTPIKILNIDMNGELVDPSLYGGRGRVLPS